MDKDDYLFTLKAEYLYQKDFMEDLESGKVALTDLAIKIPWWVKTFYQPNRCLETMLQSNKPVVNALSHDWAAAFIAMRNADYVVDQKAGKPWQYLFSTNAGGNYLIYRPDRLGFKVIGGRGIQCEALFRQTLIVIAMRRFELAHGKLPTRLEELVPQYLEEVPGDPFNDKSMRWNVQTNVVYSVGENLKDDAGKVSRPRKWSDADVGLHYFWKPEKVEKK